MHQNNNPIESENVSEKITLLESANECGSIEQSNFILNAMFNAMPDSVYCKDLEGRYIECNKAFEDFIAHTKEEIIGRTFSELITDQLDIVKFYTDVDNSVITERKTVIQDGVAMSYNGEDRYYDLVKTPLIRKNTDGEDEVFGLLAIMYDVNERYVLIKDLKNVQTHLEVALERANSGSRAKSEFLSRMSHELLTPMNAILGMSQIAKASEDVEYIKDCIEEIHTNSTHLLRLISNLLEMSSGTGTISESLFQLNILVNNIKSRTASHFSKKQQVLKIVLDESLPNEMLADNKRIEKVIYHLLTNASKFSDNNDEILLEFIQLDNTSEGFTLKVSVSDNGIGMSSELLNTVFDIFEQGDSSNTRKYQGVGIGLTLSKYLVETMGGVISVISEPHKGSTVTFTVPVSRS